MNTRLFVIACAVIAGCATPHAHGNAWNQLYKKGTGFNTAPNSTLVDAVKSRKPGRALDVGMGQGRNSLFLAREGWEVTGFDLAADGVSIARQTAATEGLALDARVADLDQWEFGTAQWDLVALIYMGGADLTPKVKQALRPGGIVVVEFFHKDAERELGHPMGAFETGQLDALYSDFDVLRSEVIEAPADFAGQRTVKLVRFVAQKR